MNSQNRAAASMECVLNHKGTKTQIKVNLFFNLRDF
jgi:hypothetical protein